jgi:hypothetical protein
MILRHDQKFEKNWSLLGVVPNVAMLQCSQNAMLGTRGNTKENEESPPTARGGERACPAEGSKGVIHLFEPVRPVVGF